MAATKNRDIPEDLVRNILKNLPVKSLLRFRCVCKSWHNLFAKPDFISKHHHKQTTLNNVSIFVKHKDGSYSPVISVLKDDFVDKKLCVTETILVPFSDEVLGPCNGLLCLYDLNERIVLWNPSTREYKTLPLSPSRTASDAHRKFFESIGFGFDSRTNDYKILRLSKRGFLAGFWAYKAELYSLNDESWREIAPFHSRNNGIFLGLIPCFKTYNDEVYHLWNGEHILSFDMANERFREIPRPVDPDFRLYYYLEFTTFKGYLSVFGHLGGGLENLFHVWMMTRQGEKESWVKESIGIGPTSVIERPLGFWKNGGWFLQDTDGCLVLYDSSTRQLKNLRVRGVDGWLQVVNYVESLVSFNGRKEDEDKDVLFVHTGMQNS